MLKPVSIKKLKKAICIIKVQENLFKDLAKTRLEIDRVLIDISNLEYDINRLLKENSHV